MKYHVAINERERERVKSRSKNNLSVFPGKYAPLLFSVAIFLLVGASIVHAAPLYSPGQTLDPTCLPTNPDCTVTHYAVSGINSDITQLSALTAATSTNLYVTATSTFAGNITAGSISTASSTIISNSSIPYNSNLVFEGDSITAGVVLPAGQDWPSVLMTLPNFKGRGQKSMQLYPVHRSLHSWQDTQQQYIRIDQQLLANTPF
jgi:hypothetical protein